MNKTILIGRFIKDPDLKETTGGTLVCSFTLAVARRFKGKDGKQEADFPQIIAFGKTAEFVKNYFYKGNQIAIVGRIQTRTWDDAEGKKHYAIEVVAEEAEFVEKKDNGLAPKHEEFAEVLEDDSELPF